MRERIAIFGGSFDPPQVGHVLAVQYVLLTAEIDRALVIPCGRHPFDKDHVPFEHRSAMCRLAFQPLGERVQVLDIEGKRDGPSYTIDTIRQLRGLFPGADFEIVIGSDLLNEIDDWKEAEEVRRSVSFRVLPRLDCNTAETEEEQEIPHYLPRLSSTGVRNMIAQGKDVSSRLPRPVLGYIREHGLYRA
ncbi:nicotinate (nicotinamide) nucleotide adenylyltransferase [Candidatus Sumerlaeota bacterium]|nr:nicotinate (nicotinamide) nucleotide adenylyltransferase [Candidatus Sumerlaeota bacterium]